MDPLSIALLSIHSSPIGPKGTKNTGGMSVVVSETARELGAMGHNADIYTAAAAGCRERVVPLSDHVRLIQLHGAHPQEIPKEELFHHLPRIHDTLESFRTHEGTSYDLVHSHYWLSGRLGHWAQRDWGVPHLITFHTLGRLKNKLGPGEAEPELRMEWEARLSRSCQRVLVATCHEKEHQVRLWELNESKVSIVPFGVNTAMFDIRNPTEARHRLNLESHDPIILFVGRFVPVKGIERLLKALSILRGRDRMLLLMIGGDGADTDTTLQLKDLSHGLGIGDKVRFLDPMAQGDLVDYYNAADILVLPSYYETFGLVVLESLACGTPVVATPVGIVDTVVENGQNGCIVEDHTAMGIATALMKVLRWIKTAQLSAPDIRASIQTYTWEGVTQTMRDEYMTAMEEMTPVPGR